MKKKSKKKSNSIKIIILVILTILLAGLYYSYDKYIKVNINLNHDFGVTTVLDLAASKYTNLVGYKKSSKNVSYYYFNL